jgi:hypothetical protein
VPTIDGFWGRGGQRDIVKGLRKALHGAVGLRVGVDLRRYVVPEIFS